MKVFTVHDVFKIARFTDALFLSPSLSVCVCVCIYIYMCVCVCVCAFCNFSDYKQICQLIQTLIFALRFLDFFPYIRSNKIITISCTVIFYFELKKDTLTSVP